MSSRTEEARTLEGNPVEPLPRRRNGSELEGLTASPQDP